MRITEKDLKAKVERLNRIIGMEDGRCTFTRTGYSIVGAYCLSFADGGGGVALHQYVDEHGGVRDIFRNGHMPKRELYNLINAYESGMEVNHDV